MKANFCRRLRLLTVSLVSIMATVTGFAQGVVKPPPRSQPLGWPLSALERETRSSVWRQRLISAVEAAAESGDGGAALELARRFAAGDGVPKSRGRATEQVRRAAEAGNPLGQYLLGRYYVNDFENPSGEHLTGNYQVAAEWFEKAARQQHAESAYQLGLLYQSGRLARDTAKTVEWLKLAAGAGHVAAARDLGVQLLSGGLTAGGQPVPANIPEGLDWCEKALEMGDDQTAEHLMSMWEEEITAATGQWAAHRDRVLVMLQKAAGRGDSGSLAWVWFLSDQLGAIPARELDQLERHAEFHRSSVANLVIARSYHHGQGRSRNLDRAATYYSRGWTRQTNQATIISAALIQLIASDELTFSSNDPEKPVLPNNPDYVRTPELRFQVAELHWRGNTLVPTNAGLAMKWYLAAAQAGSAPAMRRLGEFWEQGLNGEPDPAEARRWYRRAELAEQTRSPALKSEEGR